MSNDRWKVDAPRWRAAVTDALSRHQGNDLVVPYQQVASAFPASEPNPHFFDEPLIDRDALLAWAQANGWDVSTAPELAQDIHSPMPPIRFRR